MTDIREMTIRQIQNAFKEGSLTCEELVNIYLKRIARFDSGKKGLNSIREINPQVLEDARDKDKQRRNGRDSGLLHGIPILIKDNINTRGPMHTTAGSLALAQNIPPYEAFLVTRLKEEGAVILGKANLTEFANIMTKGMPGGYSSMGGQTWCPYREKESPSGSSSGSAVSVSANLCSVSMGTETTGSVISPAYVNGVVGIKPTVGLVSRNGILPVSKTLDIAGPMARNVEDAAILLKSIYGYDSSDPATTGIPEDFNMDFVNNLGVSSLDGLRIGINRTHAQWLEEEIPLYNQLFKRLRKAGAEIVDRFHLRESKCAAAIIIHELRESMNEYFGTLCGDIEIKSLSDVVAFNEKYRDVHRYGQLYLEMADEKYPEGTKSPTYLKKINERDDEIAYFDRIFDNNDLDIMFFDTLTDLPAVTGFPTITVPTGSYNSGMPLGSIWVARRFDEEKLIRFAYALERLTKARICPDLKRFESENQ